MKKYTSTFNKLLEDKKHRIVIDDLVIVFFPAGINIAFQGIFQAMDGGAESLIISFCRQIIFIFPFAIIFAEISKTNQNMNWLLWTVFPVAELLTAIIAILLFRRIRHKNSVKM